MTLTLLEARLTGEMAAGSVPLSTGVNLEAILGGDEDPLEIIAEVPAGKSNRGWFYTKQALSDIVNHVQKNTLAGYLGHQDPKAIDREFVAPAVHWIGALLKGDKAYFRGVVDKAQSDLKRWIRTGRIREVSIFGTPTLRTGRNGTEVVGYSPFSLDITPLGRAGMPTRIMVGEMDSTFTAASLDPDRPKHLRRRTVDICTGNSYTQEVDPATETESSSQSDGLKVKKVEI